MAAQRLVYPEVSGEMAIPSVRNGLRFRNQSPLERMAAHGLYRRKRSDESSAKRTDRRASARFPADNKLVRRLVPGSVFRFAKAGISVPRRDEEPADLGILTSCELHNGYVQVNSHTDFTD